MNRFYLFNGYTIGNPGFTMRLMVIADDNYLLASLQAKAELSDGSGIASAYRLPFDPRGKLTWRELLLLASVLMPLPQDPADVTDFTAGELIIDSAENNQIDFPGIDNIVPKPEGV